VEQTGPDFALALLGCHQVAKREGFQTHSTAFWCSSALSNTLTIN
jgi:hypothetical protein